jgi:hypothetical protein
MWMNAYSIDISCWHDLAARNSLPAFSVKVNAPAGWRQARS